jgi:DNA repair protein RecO (recombination protein O)
MLHKTKGIVFHHIKYSDNSMVAYVYTEQFGRQSYMIKGAYTKKSQVKAGLFQPLNLLQLEVYHKPNNELQKIKEAAIDPMFTSIPFHPSKTAISIFLAEVLYRTIREEAANEDLFNFVFHAVQVFDLMQTGFADFHLVFLIQFSKLLGFFPTNNFQSEYPVFDLLAGKFLQTEPMHGHFLESSLGEKFSQLLEVSFENIQEVELTNDERREILTGLVDYYSCHLEPMGKIKSLQVLTEVFK